MRALDRRPYTIVILLSREKIIAVEKNAVALIAQSKVDQLRLLFVLPRVTQKYSHGAR
jgi:hypothetical protein